MRVNRYVIALLIFTVVFSCNSNRREEQELIADTKKEQLQTKLQSGKDTTAMKETEQKQSEKYDTVVIGSQVWMTENIDVSHFRNGDKIPRAATVEEWKKAAETNSPAWCYYENDKANGQKYGKLYNWYAVNDARGLAPKGWRIPNNEDWEQLGKHIGKGNYIGGFSLYAKRLMSVEWDGGNNKTGFNALPAGGRFTDGEYKGINDYAYFWSSDNDKHKYDEIERAYSLTLMDFSELSMLSSYPKEYGLSVRCIK